MYSALSRLLLLEDDENDAQLVQQALEEHAPGEFAITRVERLAEALAQIRTEHFDAMLADLRLPDSIGLATVQAIAEHAHALPLVVLTGMSEEDLGRKAVRHGAHDYLLKGKSGGRSVARALRYAIERKRLEIGLRTANEALERRVAERTAELEIANRSLHESQDRLRQAYQERERLSQDLHDGIVQSIYAVGLRLEQAQRQITEDAQEARKNLSEAIMTLNAVIREVRNHIVGLKREELNWMQLLTELRAVLHSAAATHGVQFSLDADPIVLAQLSAGTAYEVLNIVREAVSNSRRHSGGKRGQVSLSARDGRVLLAIEDDGTGFDVLKARGAGQGLGNLAARAAALAAQLDIRSSPGHGTRVIVEIPLERVHVRG